MSPSLIFYTKPASGSSIKLSKVLPAHIPADIFTLRSWCLPGFPPEVRFIGFSDPRKLSGVLLSSYNTWPWRSVVWGWPFSQFLHHSSLLPTHCKSHMLPHHTPTHLHLSQPKNLYMIWGMGEVALTLYIISKLSPWPQVLTPLSEIQKPGRKCYALYLLSRRFLELSSSEPRQMGGVDRGDAWEGGRWAWVSHLNP